MKIEVYLDKAVFRRFTMFDILKRRKLWRSPVWFAGILGVCACICFLMHHVDGAVLLGSILLIVGLGMPCVYFSTFFLSLNRHIAANGLTSPRLVYTLELTGEDDGIHIHNENEQAAYLWKDVYHIYRDTSAIYLYMTADRAFLLPNACMEGAPDDLWQFLRSMVPAEKATDLRGKK